MAATKIAKKMIRFIVRLLSVREIGLVRTFEGRTEYIFPGFLYESHRNGDLALQRNLPNRKGQKLKKSLTICRVLEAREDTNLHNPCSNRWHGGT